MRGCAGTTENTFLNETGAGTISAPLLPQGYSDTRGTSRICRVSAGPGCLPGQFPDFCNIAPVVPPIVNRCLADQREGGKYRVVQDAPEPVLPDEPEADVLVPVKAA